MLITIEGIDGAGKTTLATALAQRLNATLLREPGGVELSERIRALVKDPNLTVAPEAEALLYAAARAQLVHERLKPLLEANTTVVLDRFVDSSLAYQGAARGLGIEQVRAINALATQGLTPDLTLLLRLDPGQGRARQTERADEPDRLEQEPDAFFQTIADAYDALARAEPHRFKVLDASQPPDAVLHAAVEAVRLST